jgi:hypothetical protein
MTKPNATDHHVFKYTLMKEKEMRLSFLNAFTERNDIIDAVLHPTDFGDRYPVVYECTTKGGDVFIAEVAISSDRPWTDNQKVQYKNDVYARHIMAKEKGLIGKNQQVYHFHFLT